MESNLNHHLEDIQSLCRAYNVEALYLFGSAAKGDFENRSDYDFLVRFSNKVNLLDYADNYFALLEKLRKTLKKDIDLVTEKSLRKPILIEEINKTRIQLYGA